MCHQSLGAPGTWVIIWRSEKAFLEKRLFVVLGGACSGEIGCRLCAPPHRDLGAGMGHNSHNVSG